MFSLIRLLMQEEIQEHKEIWLMKADLSDMTSAWPTKGDNHSGNDPISGYIRHMHDKG